MPCNHYLAVFYEVMAAELQTLSRYLTLAEDLCIGSSTVRQTANQIQKSKAKQTKANDRVQPRTWKMQMHGPTGRSQKNSRPRVRSSGYMLAVWRSQQTKQTHKHKNKTLSQARHR